MRRYVIQRILEVIPVAMIVTLFVFLMLLAMPGDPLRAIIGQGEALDAEQMVVMRHQYHLDQPWPVQYFIWLGSALQGDLGRSSQTRRLVTAEIFDRMPLTIELGLASWGMAVLIAIPFGLISAFFRASLLDLAVTLLAIAGVALPGFWFGIMMILLFGVQLGWLPTHGYVSLLVSPVDGARHLLLPVIALGITGAAIIMRQMRSSALEALSQDYVRTARSKGATESRVVVMHALRNSLLPVVTIMGLQFGRLFGGAVVIETLFALPGIGRLLVDAVFQRDLPVVQACVLMMAIAVLAANLITDLAYAYLDPRIRY